MLTKPKFKAGAVERSGIPVAGGDLAEGAGENAPLMWLRNSERRPHPRAAFP